jgi:hypothetical protein
MQNLQIIEMCGVTIPHFDFDKIGVQGIGINNTPIVNMDKYIDHSMDSELHTECLIGLSRCEQYFKQAMIFGDIPPSSGVSWTNIIKNLDKYDPTGNHRLAIEKLLTEDKSYKSVYRYMYFGMGAAIPWFFGLYLKDNAFFKKTSGGNLTKASAEFPLLMEYIKSLPFKEIGRILFFATYPGAGVITHRDAHMIDHKDHNMNLFFEAGSRPSYVFNEINNEKIYLEKGAKSYFFNNRDYHGVDPEPNFRYTLRIDGTFTDELCEELGLVNGYTWHNNFKKDYI